MTTREHIRPGINWRLAPDSALPPTDPHGRPWGELTNEQLREVAGWCMSGADHEAFRRAWLDRGDD